MMSSAPTPRTPKGWMRLLLSIVGWAALGIVTLGTIAWVFFGTYGLTMYFIAVAYLLIAVACGQETPMSSDHVCWRLLPRF